MAALGRLGGWLYQRPYLLVLLTYFMWALNVVVGRTAAGHVPPITLTMGRWGPAVADPAAIRVAASEARLARHPRSAAARVPARIHRHHRLCGRGLLALQYTEAINGLLIQCTMPLMIGIMAFVLVGDRLTGRQIAGIVISLIGVMAILLRGDLARVALDHVQSRRSLVRGRDRDFLVLFAAGAQEPEGPSAVAADRLRHRPA